MLRLRPFDFNFVLDAFEVHSNVRNAFVNVNALLCFQTFNLVCDGFEYLICFHVVAVKFHRFPL